MTKEQLDAIRTLHSNCEHSYNGLFRVHLTEADYAALLAEVERLTAERAALQVGDTASTALEANERFAPSENVLLYIEKWCNGSGPCAVELEPHGHWRLSRSVSLASVRNAERDAAFSRGVAAMREATASHFSVVAPYDYIAPRIRSLPDPEDK